MEPSINSDLAFLDLDITPAQMQDIGWTTGTSNFNVFNLDPPGVGFTDPTPFTGAPGNPATTLGEARINVFNAVLTAWANTLDSPIDIDVEVTWQSLFCDPNQGAVLAGASTILIFQSSGFPFSNTWYHSALSEALTGQELSGDSSDNDVFVIVNSAIDDECLLPGSGYYYGLDGNNASNQIDLAPVVLHEVGHGLGFANFTDETDGQLTQGIPGVFDHFTYDTTLGRTWADMTDAERVASAVNTRRVVWNGPLAAAAAADTLEPGVEELNVTSPAEVAGRYEVGTASFGVPVPGAGIAGEIVGMTDAADLGPADTATNGCSAATNPAEINGQIALIDDGLCRVTDKVLNAQAAGAIGAIIVNVASNAPNDLSGDSALPITIATVSLGRDDGERLRNAAGSACTPDATTLCIDNSLNPGDRRFRVTMSFETTQGGGRKGDALAIPLTAVDVTKGGLFAFSDPENPEVLVKVLNGCNGANPSFWVFYAPTTNFGFELTVFDTLKNQSKTYVNPDRNVASSVGDRQALATCP